MKRLLALTLLAVGLASGPALAQSVLTPPPAKPASAPAAPANPERALSLKVIVPAPIGDVWKAWMSAEGLRTFFAPGAKVEPVTGGAYEIWFNPYAPEGMRGTDGMQLLAMQEPTMFTFTWIAPPTMPAMRKQVTYVTVRLAPKGDKATEVSLLHGGWGEGTEWDAYYANAEKTWQSTLSVLARRFQGGPVDWTEIEKRLRAIAPVQAK